MRHHQTEFVGGENKYGTTQSRPATEIYSPITMFFSLKWVYFIILLLTFACSPLQMLQCFKEHCRQINIAPRVSTTSETLKI